MWAIIWHHRSCLAAIKNTTFTCNHAAMASPSHVRISEMLPSSWKNFHPSTREVFKQETSSPLPFVSSLDLFPQFSSPLTSSASWRIHCELWPEDVICLTLGLAAELQSQVSYKERWLGEGRAQMESWQFLPKHPRFGCESRRTFSSGTNKDGEQWASSAMSFFEQGRNDWPSRSSLWLQRFSMAFAKLWKSSPWLETLMRKLSALEQRQHSMHSGLLQVERKSGRFGYWRWMQ